MATIICPSCGGENQITGKSRKECAYCGSPLPMPEKKKTSSKKSETKGDAKFPTAQYYIPINDDLQDKESVIAAFRQYLVNKDNIPVDIFDNMEIVDVKWYYLPMIRYAGDVDTEWSCNQVVAKQREIGQRPIRDKNGAIVRWETEYETYYDYIPKSGRGHSTFDVLVPCGTGLKPIGGLKDCYHRIDFVDIDDINAQEWPIKGSVTPRNAFVDTSLADLSENNHEILEDVAREVHWTAKRCSFKPFREDERSDEHLNYSQKLTSSTGELFYIPFVHVVYRYNGATYDWAFLQSPSIREDGIHPELEEDESPVAMLQAEFLEKRKKLERKEIWSMALSFVFTTPIGGVIYFLMTNSKISKAKRRLNTQMDLATLLYRLKRKERLAAHGGTAKISDEDIEDLYDETAGDYDGPEDSWLYDGGEKPTTIAGIEEYFEETERVYKRALKSIRNFWWDILVPILLVGAFFTVNYCIKSIQEKKENEQWERLHDEEMRIAEAKRAKGDLGKMGFPKGVKEIEIIESSWKTITLSFDTNGGITDIEICDGGSSGKTTMHYNVSNGKIIKSTRHDSSDSYYKENEYFGGTSIPKNHTVSYRYANETRTSVSGGETTQETETCVYAKINGVEEKVATLGGIFGLEYMSYNPLKNTYYDNLSSNERSEYVFPNIAMELLNIKLKMPTDFELLSGTAERPEEIRGFGKITYY